MASKPIVTTGVALMSAAAIVAATPALLFNPGPEVHVAAPAAVAPLRQLTVSDIQLLNTFSLTGLFNTVVNGYGGIVTGDPVDPTGFACDTDAGQICKSTVFGAAYYLTDTLLLPGTTLDNHLFEEGLITGLAEFARENGAPDVVIDIILQPFRAPVFLSEAIFGEFSPVTQFLTALWDGGIVGVINFLINGPEPAPPEEPEATLLANANTGGVETLEATEEGTSTVGTFKAPDLSKLVSLQVKPQEEVEDAVEGDETLTVDTTAGDTTEVEEATTEDTTVETVEVQDPTTVETTVEPAKTEEPTVEVQEPTTEEGTVETVKTEKPKLNEKKSNPLADGKGKGKEILPETIAEDAEAPAEETTGTKTFGKQHKNEATGTDGAAADSGGSESGGGDAE